MIFRIKNLDKHVHFNHFKMDTLQGVLSLMTPNCYTASVDLKDASYSVPIAVAHQKYLKFEWGGKLYQFTYFPSNNNTTTTTTTILFCLAHINITAKKVNLNKQKNNSK